MAFIIGNRNQAVLFPAAIEDYVAADAPVRVYDAFVEALNFEELGIRIISLPQGGAEEYHPKDMLKLLIYGPSYGIRSSRKLERACHDNISFIWLMKGLKPDYRTVARFRAKNKEAIKEVLKQCVRMCISMNLIEGNTLFIDGSKVRANASINSSWNEKRCEKFINKVETKINQLMETCEQEDKQEEGQESLVRLKQNICNKKNLIEKMKATLKDIKAGNKKFINTTDPDSTNGKSRQGTHAIYNLQNTVDSKHGLIVNSDCVSQSNDYNQLSQQVTAAKEIIGKPIENVCADAGYADVDDLKKIDTAVNIIVPSKRQAQKEKGIHPFGRFNRSHFIYHKQEDEYECPAGQRLTYRGNNSGKHNKTYRIQGSICRGCKYFGECTKSKKVGRKIIRLNDEEFKEKLEENYLKTQNQAIYILRKQTVEHPFGHLKKNLGVGQFLLRGKAKVDAEISILSTCFNIRRLMTILGIPQLIAKLQTL